MLLVLDSNEYIFTFGPVKDPCSESFLKKLPELSNVAIRIPRLIVREVSTKLTPEAFKEFLKFVNILTIIDEDIVVPFELGAKYEVRGLKPADAFIAAYTEWTGADVLVTENRHFLNRHSNLPFKVLSAEKCLKLLK